MSHSAGAIVFAAAILTAAAARAQPAPTPTPTADGPAPGAKGDAAGTPAAGGEPPATTPPPATVPVRGVTSSKPPPLHVEYLQYGVAIAAEVNVNDGSTCRPEDSAPCILGSGGGLAIRGGYRSPGPWYVGGAYEFVKMDSSNLYRLGIFQQLRLEMRYLPDIGYRAAPYASWGLGAVAYGNEWGAETGGGLAFGGAGMELEVSRTAVLGLGFVYRPVLLAGWKDKAGQDRPTSLVQFVGFEFVLEVRSELGRK